MPSSGETATRELDPERVHARVKMLTAVVARFEEGKGAADQTEMDPVSTAVE